MTSPRAVALTRLFGWAGALSERELESFASELDGDAPLLGGPLARELHQKLVIEHWASRAAANLDNSSRQAGQLRDRVRRLEAELARARAERDEARGWARSEFHQMWDAPFLPDDAPAWLTEPV